ncbi:hypothetical protein LXJ15735_27260 [Lacrimispora xylanolytica]
MKFTNTKVFNFDGAIRGMRNPMNSWHKSDSWQSDFTNDVKEGYFIGANDMKLAQQLIRAGSEHRKFLRQITVSVDIKAPLYWWKEFDTYKVGTTANSTSTMHKLASTEITKDCFEMGDYQNVQVVGAATTNTMWKSLIMYMEVLRKKYNQSKDIQYWKELIRVLPESWLQTRTITLNYENLYSIIRHRNNHKLTEWRESFIDWCRTLPFVDELLFLELEKGEK